MGPDDRALARVRWSYETGRLARALPAALVFVPTTWLAGAACAPSHLGPSTTLVVGILGAVIALAAGVWRRAGRDAARVGVTTGLLPLLLPLLLRGSCAAENAGLSPCLLACGAAGALSGAIVASWASASRAQRGARLVWAGTIAALMGSQGCLAAGAVGVVTMALAALVAAVPAFTLRPAGGWPG